MRKALVAILVAAQLCGCASGAVPASGGSAPVTASHATVSAVAAQETVGVTEVLATEAVAAAATGAATAGSVAVGAGGLAASVWLAGAAPAVLFGMVFAAVFVSEGLGYEPPAVMDPTRAVHEQDCTKPIDYTRGNLKCVPAARQP
jgi:hypothetical protein